MRRDPWLRRACRWLRRRRPRGRRDRGERLGRFGLLAQRPVLGLPPLEPAVELGRAPLGNVSRAGIVRTVLEPDGAPRLRVVGGPRPPAGLLRAAEQQPRDRADVRDQEHQDQPHALGQIAAQRPVGRDAVEERPDPEDEQEEGNDALSFEEHGEPTLPRRHPCRPLRVVDPSRVPKLGGRPQFSLPKYDGHQGVHVDLGGRPMTRVQTT